MSRDQRQHPRMSRRLRVTAAALELFTTNVAAGGIQLECPDLRYTGLMNQRRGNYLALRLELPGELAPLSVQGEVRYADPVGDGYLIGIAFSEWGDDAAGRWRDFVERTAAAESRPS